GGWPVRRVVGPAHGCAGGGYLRPAMTPPSTSQVRRAASRALAMAVNLAARSPTETSWVIPSATTTPRNQFGEVTPDLTGMLKVHESTSSWDGCGPYRQARAIVSPQRQARLPLGTPFRAAIRHAAGLPYAGSPRLGRQG